MHHTVPTARPPAAGATWRNFAACLTIGPEPFFPDGGDRASARAAKRVCATCPVTSECLNFAFLTGADFGIFGRLTAQERRVMLRRERRAAA
jgi:WhiB family redox-sensing transcriptional regulator